MSFRYPASVRLKRGWEFDLVFRTGRREKGALVRLFFVGGGEGGARLGVTVGRKVGNAAVRSRGRRVMRESLRRLLPWVRPGVRAVASLREGGIGASARAVYAELSRLCLKAGLLLDSWPGPDFDVDARPAETSGGEGASPCPSPPASCS